MSAVEARPRVALVSSYFPLYDEQLPPDFRDRRVRAARACAELLAGHFDLVDAGLVAGEEDGAQANRRLAADRLDAIVLAPAMVGPPSWVLRAIDGVEAPIVIWNAPGIRRLPAQLDQAEATAETTHVSCVMLANALMRSGRPFEVVTARASDGAQAVVRTVRAAAVATALRGTTALRIGDPIGGYLDVESTSAELAALGVGERAITIDELDAAFAAAADPAPGAQPTNAWLERADDRSIRLSTALRALVARHGAQCGTVNCHGPWLRQNPNIGICACVGVSLLTGEGVPFSCTGDQPTALTLLLARRLTGRALYCELYAPELETGLMLLAAGGEGDPAWAQPGAPIAVGPNDHYPGVHGAGAGIAFRVARGPATLLSLSPAHDGWRLAWAPGEVVESRYGSMGGPNAMFRFDSGPAGEAGTRWIASGATHHTALAAGRLDVEAPVLARALGIRSVQV